MSSEFDYDVIVIGSGPGGYVSAIRASQLGLKAAVIEKEKAGGVCLNVGCIPSKALIHQAEIVSHAQEASELGIGVDRSTLDYRQVYNRSRQAAETLSKGVRFLLRKHAVKYLEGQARIVAPDRVSIDGGKTLKTRAIVIATGSRPAEIAGFPFDEERIVSSTGLLMLQRLPKRLAILGAGYIGMEFAHVMNAFGVEVTVIEMLNTILPTADSEASAVLHKDFRRRGIEMLLAHRAVDLKRNDGALTVVVEDSEARQARIEADLLLVATGRRPNSEDLGLETVGIKTERGFIPVGDYYRTSVEGIYAIGDVIDSPMLAHVASGEGEIAIEHIAGSAPSPRVDPDLIPGAIYTQPELASFGPTESQLEERGIGYEKSVFPYRGAGKSVAIGHPEGLVKLLYAPDSHEILAAHVAGYSATELIHELLLAKRSELLPEEIATMIHAHPTMSEAVMEAARGAEGWMIHF